MDGKRRPRGRHSLRLKDYDYSLPGAYFITIPTRDRLPFLGVVSGDAVCLSEIGEIARACWLEIPEHYPRVAVDAHMVMPDHLHGLLLLVGARHGVPQREAYGKPVPGSIPSIVRSFKSACTLRVKRELGLPEGGVWERDFYEHVVRSERALARIREYILNNPAKLTLIRFGPA